MSAGRSILREGIEFGKKGGTAIADQGLYAAANFVVNILLARELSIDEYGAFAIAFAIHNLVFRPYSALIIEPMSVLLPEHSQDKLEQHFGRHLIYHGVLTGILMLGVLAASAVLRFTDQPQLLFASIAIFSVVLPAILLFGLLRQMLYIKRLPKSSLTASLIYFFVVVTAVFGLRSTGTLSSPGMLLVLGLANIIGCGWMMIQIGIRIPEIRWRLDKGQIMKNWTYGKWMVLSSVFLAGATELPILAASSMFNIGTAGVLKVAQNIFRPLQITVISIASFSLPVLSRFHLENNGTGFKQRFRLTMLTIMVPALAYGLLVIAFRQQIESILFAGNYRAYVDLFSLWAILGILYSIFHGLGVSAKAQQMPSRFSAASGVFALATIIASIFLIPRFDVWGVTFAIIIGYVFGAFSFWIFETNQLKGLLKG